MGHATLGHLFVGACPPFPSVMPSVCKARLTLPFTMLGIHGCELGLDVGHESSLSLFRVTYGGYWVYRIWIPSAYNSPAGVVSASAGRRKRRRRDEASPGGRPGSARNERTSQPVLSLCIAHRLCTLSGPQGRARACGKPRVSPPGGPRPAQMNDVPG